MSVKIKICGIRDIDTALACVAASVDFIGLNFVPESKRYISPLAARKIADTVRKDLVVVGVFMNEKLNQVNTIIDTVGLDYAQLHGNETPAYCRQVNAQVIKVYGLEADFNLDKTIENMQQYPVEIYLIDRKKSGTGEMFDLVKVGRLSAQFKLMFAGGLTLGNVGRVIRKVRPYAVDVASGVETNGKKDAKKIRQFVVNCRSQIYR